METKTGPPFAGAPVGVQPGSVVLQPMPRRRTREEYKSKASKILGMIQIVAALIILIFSVVAYKYSVDENSPNVVQFAQGFGNIIFFILSGSFALAAGKKRTPCLIVAHMVLAILASLAAVHVMCTASKCIAYGVGELGEYDSIPFGNDGIEVPDYDRGNLQNDYINPDGPANPEPLPLNSDGTRKRQTLEDSDTGVDDYGMTQCWFFGYEGNDAKIRVNIAAWSVVMLLGVIEFITTIWGSALTCATMCCCAKQAIAYSHIEEGQAHVVVINGQAYTMATGPVVTIPTTDQVGPLPEKTDLKEAFVEVKTPGSPPPAYN